MRACTQVPLHKGGAQRQLSRVSFLSTLAGAVSIAISALVLSQACLSVIGGFCLCLLSQSRHAVVTGVVQGIRLLLCLG